MGCQPSNRRAACQLQKLINVVATQ